MPANLKIYFVDKFKKGPWGGGNQFLRNLHAWLDTRGMVTERVEEASHLFVNSYQNFELAIELKSKYPAICLVHRLGPIFSLHRASSWFLVDQLLARITSWISDLVVFQSQWSRRQTTAMGFHILGCPSVVISNAADPAIYKRSEPLKHFARQPLKVIICTWSKNSKKGFVTYQSIDRQVDPNEIILTFVGNSPVKFKNIRMLEPLSGASLATEMQKHHVLLTATEDDAASNVIVEAKALGLKVVALESGGNRELLDPSDALYQGQSQLQEILKQLYEADFSCESGAGSSGRMDQIGEQYVRALENTEVRNIGNPKIALLAYRGGMLVFRVVKAMESILHRIIWPR